MRKLCEYFRKGRRRKWESRIVAALMNEPLSAQELAELRRKLAKDSDLRTFARESAEDLSLLSEAMGSPLTLETHPLWTEMENMKHEDQPGVQAATNRGRFGWWPEICGAAACLLLLGALYPIFNKKWIDSMEASISQASPLPVVSWREELAVLEGKTEVESTRERSAGVNYFQVPESSGLQDRDSVTAQKLGLSRVDQSARSSAPKMSGRAPREDSRFGVSQPQGGMNGAVSTSSVRALSAPAPSSVEAPARVLDELQSHLVSRGRERIVLRENLPVDSLDLGEDRRMSGDSVYKRKAPEMLTVEGNPFSTFSLNVSDVSFQLALAQLQRGERPVGENVRPEEFYNYFEYADPAPGSGQPIAFFAENAQVPFLHGQQLVRFSVKTSGEGREAGRPLNLTLLIDHSGSMVRADRQRILERFLGEMGSFLSPEDRVHVVTFSTNTSVLGMNLAPNQLSGIQQKLAQMSPQGGTNLELALKTGYALAEQYKQDQAVSRVILLTDGAANLGNIGPEKLGERIKHGKLQGVFFDVVGVGWDDYNDALLERLTREGDGRYRFINNEDEVSSLLHSLAGAFRPAAKDVKVQVEWNPRQVARYRLIGYETHRLRDEDFRDDSVDAAELAANETGNALYLIERTTEAEGPLGTVNIRFRPAAGGAVRELAWVLPSNIPQDLYEAPASLQLAAAAAFFAEKFSNPQATAGIRLQDLARLLEQPQRFYPDQTRIRELSVMIQQAMRLE